MRVWSHDSLIGDLYCAGTPASMMGYGILLQPVTARLVCCDAVMHAMRGCDGLRCAAMRCMTLCNAVRLVTTACDGVGHAAVGCNGGCHHLPGLPLPRDPTALPEILFY